MRLNIGFWVLLFLASASSAQAGFRVTAGVGLGSTSSTNEITMDEGPLTQNYGIEFIYHSKLLLGVEHTRSLNMSPAATSISFTGLSGRFYLNSIPTPYADGDTIKTNELIIRDIGYFIGGGIGFAQSSLPTDETGASASAAGIYISPRFGAEVSLTRNWGLRTEILIAVQIFGSGQITSTSLLGSLFYTF